jgi:ribosomal protein S14
MKAGRRWACLCGTALIACLQESETHEIHVWLVDPEEKPVDLEGTSATLTVQDRKGWKKTRVMPVATPGSPGEGRARGERRKVPGTPFRAELLFQKPASKHPGGPAEATPPVFDHPQLPVDPSPGEKTHGSAPSGPPGPAFRSPFVPGELPTEGEIVVHLTLPDDRKASVRWTLPLWEQVNPVGEGWREPWDAMAEVDRHLRAEKRDEARTAADRLVRGLQNALKDAERDAKKSEDCLSAALEVRRHAQEGKEEPALRSLEICKTRFRELAPFEDRMERDP